MSLPTQGRSTQRLSSTEPSLSFSGFGGQLPNLSLPVFQECCDDSFGPFTLEELQEAIKQLKPGKAAGLDGITTEMIQHFGEKAREWILAMINKSADSFAIPTAWRKAKVVALLKPGKEPTKKKRATSPFPS